MLFFSALKLDVVPVPASRLCSAHSSRHAIGLEGVEEEVSRRNDDIKKIIYMYVQVQCIQVHGGLEKTANVTVQEEKKGKFTRCNKVLIGEKQVP